MKKFIVGIALGAIWITNVFGVCPLDRCGSKGTEIPSGIRYSCTRNTTCTGTSGEACFCCMGDCTYYKCECDEGYASTGESKTECQCYIPKGTKGSDLSGEFEYAENCFSS